MNGGTGAKPVEVRCVLCAGDIRRFVRFPFKLYSTSEQWVPPLISDELKRLRSQSAASEQCRVSHWLALRDGNVVGRVSGIINERYIRKRGENRARFGWLEFVDDPSVSTALFGALERWAGRESASGVHGPMGFTGLDPEGLLIEGFEESGTMSEIYNYPYYAHHIEGLGYRKDKDWVEYRLSVPKGVPEKAVRVGKLVLKRGGYRIVDATRAGDLIPYIGEVFELLNEAYSHLYGAVELTPSQVREYSDKFMRFIDPRFNKVVVDKSGKLVAFGLTFPCMAEAMKKAKGRLVPTGFFHLRRAIKHPKALNLGLIAVRPECQGRGIPAVMMSEITKSALECGITCAETGRELEDNLQVRTLWKSYHARQHKRRRVYVKEPL